MMGDDFPNEDQCGYWDDEREWWRIEPCGEGYECDEDDCSLPAAYEATMVPSDEAAGGWTVLCREHMCQRSGLDLD